MNTMDIKYPLATPGNHKDKNAYRSIQNFKNHFIVGICSVYAEFQLKLWDIMLQQSILSLNLL